MTKDVDRSKNPLIAATVVLLTAGCATSAGPASMPDTKAWSTDAQQQRDLMVGKWLGEVSGNDGLRLTLIERNDNGTYRLTFRTYKGNDYEESVEVGLWGISGSIYFTVMRGWIIDGEFVPADSTRAYFYDAYKVSNLDATSFEFKSLDSDNRYTNRRVGDDFRFSD